MNLAVACPRCDNSAEYLGSSMKKAYFVLRSQLYALPERNTVFQNKPVKHLSSPAQQRGRQLSFQ